MSAPVALVVVCLGVTVIISVTYLISYRMELDNRREERQKYK